MKFGDVTENGLFSIVDHCSIVKRIKTDCFLRPSATITFISIKKINNVIKHTKLFIHCRFRRLLYLFHVQRKRLKLLTAKQASCDA